ncbi:hypothetical protein ABZS66_22660 [Dactylosporangium sp. NPDC005572]|uniref:hypothetical protein n=1 Tax=Dactylosporangium sp. NPDC005572 TaxID=3156889 RepID=UPI0033B651FF
MKLARRAAWQCACGVLLVAALGGMPPLLWRLQIAVVSAIDWIAIADRPLRAATLMLVMIAAGWLLWGWLLTATVRDVADLVRGAAAARPRLPVPLHHAVVAIGGIVGTLVQPALGFADMLAQSTAVASNQGHVEVRPTYPAATPPARAVVHANRMALVAADQAGLGGNGPAVVEQSVGGAPLTLTYTVRRGDYLARIAADQLGDAGRWPEIFAMNRGTRFPVGGKLTDPDVIYPGWQLRLPRIQPATPPVVEVPPPADAGPSSHGDDNEVGPAPTGASPKTPSSPDAPEVAASAAVDGDRFEAGDESLLPWLLLTGAAVATVAGVRYVRRRSTSRPGTPGGGPATGTAVAGLDREPVAPASQVRGRPNQGRDRSSSTGPSGQPPLAEAVVDADRSPWATPAGRHAGAVAEAARAVIAASLEARAVDGEPSVIVPAATLVALTGVRADVAANSAVTVTTTAAEAVTAAELQVLRRARHVAEQDPDAAVDEVKGVADRLPPLALVVESGDPAVRGRVEALLAQGAGLNVAGFVLEAAAPPLREGLVEHASSAVMPEAADVSPAGDRAVPAGRVKVRIRVLREVAVLDAAGEVVGGMRGHAKELLVYLAVHRRGARLPDILEAIWPDATVTRAGQRLSTDVANLRRSIRLACGDATIQPVLNTGGRYHLDPKLLDVDLWRFTDALTAIAATADRFDRADLLRSAVGVHAGPLAGELAYAWVDGAREACRRQGIKARRDLAALVAADDPAEAADLLDAAAELDPASDGLAREAMTAFAGLGVAERLEARWRQLHAALAEIGESSEAATTTLYRQLHAELRTHPHERPTAATDPAPAERLDGRRT